MFRPRPDKMIRSGIPLRAHARPIQANQCEALRENRGGENVLGVSRRRVFENRRAQEDAHG